MRPVTKGAAPHKYKKYQDAIGDLEDRLGLFCSYCEERFSSALEVEHVSPKSRGGALTDWKNFLLACKTCNTLKGKQAASQKSALWPDKDNTFLVFEYKAGGFVVVKKNLPPATAKLASELMKLVKLDRHLSTPGKKPTKRDKRYRLREKRWTAALEVKAIYSRAKANNPRDAVRMVVIAASGLGFFSVWMTVFHDVPAVRKALIKEFTGTATDCFDAKGAPLTRPNGRI